MDPDALIAIDAHTHLEVSCRNPFDNHGEKHDRAAAKYFRSSKRPTMQETIDFHREKKIGFVNFTVTPKRSWAGCWLADFEEAGFKDAERGAAAGLGEHASGAV